MVVSDMQVLYQIALDILVHTEANGSDIVVLYELPVLCHDGCDVCRILHRMQRDIQIGIRF